MCRCINAICKVTALILITVFVLLFGGCDLFEASKNGDASEGVHPQFSYEMYDESGQVINEVSNTRAGGTEIQTSLGLFGDNFLPPFIAEQIEIDPELLKMHEIILHAEEGIREEVRFVTLRFRFPSMKQWQKGTYPFPDISRDEWVEQLERIWKRLQQNRPDALSKGRSIRVPGISATFSDEQLASMSYMETGLLSGHHYGTSIEPTNYFYTAAGGHIELQSVDKDRVEGRFEVDLFSVPMEEIFFADEFPEDPEIQPYRIVGSFVTKPGDFSDLQQVLADLFESYTTVSDPVGAAKW